MEEKSIWSSSIKMDEFVKLNKDINTNVLIVGGGISGLLCAYELKKRNIDYILVEKDKIASQISKNTTAFVTAQHETLYQDIVKKYGIERAKEYLNINLKAINEYEKLSKIYDFDFKKCPSILYTNLDKELIINEKQTLDKLGYNCEYVDSLPLDLPILSGLKFNNQATINPLKLIKCIAKDLNIYENTKITKINNNIAYTSSNNKIYFNKVVIATHFPFINKNGLYFIKMHQRRSYVVAFKHKAIEATYTCIDQDGYYFRSYNDYLIIGGNDRDNKTICNSYFSQKVKKDFKDVDIVYKWSNQDCITLDGIPYIGKYDKIHNNWYVITGFNMWGFSWAMAASFIIADMIEHNKQCALTNPNRTILHKKLFLNIKNTIKNLVSIKTPRCSHLGCKLNYNFLEQVFECPCHGSRYKSDGTIIDGPATKDKKIKHFDKHI